MKDAGIMISSDVEALPVASYPVPISIPTSAREEIGPGFEESFAPEGGSA